MTQNGKQRYEAYEAFLQSHRDAVWHACWRYAGGDNELCKDLEQEVFIVLWLHFDELDEAMGKWQQRAWVKKITRSVIIDLHRRNYTVQNYQLSTINSQLSAPDTDYTELLDDLLANLSDDERQLMQLHLEGYDSSEIASKLGIKRNAVYQRMFRAVSKAKRAIVVLLIALVASALAVAVVPQLRQWVFPNANDANQPSEELPMPTISKTPACDTIPDSTYLHKSARHSRKHMTMLSPMPLLSELTDTSRPVVTAAVTKPCGCPVRIGTIGTTTVLFDDCDTTDDEKVALPEVTIMANGDFIVVEDAFNETVSIFDDHGSLVATAICNGHCSIPISHETALTRGCKLQWSVQSGLAPGNPTSYWVQVGSRPRVRVFM